MPIILNGSTGEVFPSWTTAGRPSSPTASQTGYNTTIGILEFWNGTAWVPAAGAIGSSGDQVFMINNKTVSTSYTLANNVGAVSVGPITLANGASVSIPSGSRYVVL